MNFSIIAGRRSTLAVIFIFITTLSALAQNETRPHHIQIRLLMVNDVYQFAPVDRGTSGGLARVSTIRKQILKESPNTLFLLSGDTISPSVESNTYKGQQMIDAWNAIGLDYSVFGNHEFDFGPQVLIDRIKESKFKWLGTNVIDRKTGRTFEETPPFVVREFEGVKVGIFGITLPETKVTSRPGPDVDFLNPCDTARMVIPAMRASGVKVIIALTHLSMHEDKELARCAEPDIIVGGHEHTLFQSIAGHTPIFKMASDAREVGSITLNVDAASGELESVDWQIIPVTSEIADDPAFAPVTQKYGKLLAELSERVGHTDVELDAMSESNRTRETNVGDFVADAFRKETGADVALLNGGSIRADLTYNSGDLTKREVLSILPFPSPVVKIEITGATLRAALEHGVARSAEDKQPGRFPQVSGIQFTFDARRPAGSRLINVNVNGQPLDDKKTYTLATSTFLAIDGGDDYKMLTGQKFLIRPERGTTAPEVLRKAIASQKSIAPKVEGRIKRVDAPEEKK